MVVQEILLSCNVAEDITEETEFVEDILDSKKGFGFSADDWFDIIIDAMHEYDIEVTVDNCSEFIEFLSADNCSTNRSLSTKPGKLLMHDMHECVVFFSYTLISYNRNSTHWVLQPQAEPRC
jgi:hypothetical protein